MTTCAAPLLAAPAQPEIGARAKKIIASKGLRFKDLNGNCRIDAYEDWRLPAQKRAADLVRRVTLAEKAGMMLIATNNPDCGGRISDRGRDLIDTQKMTRFILRAKMNTQGPECTVKLTGFALRGGYAQTPLQMAGFTNDVQKRLEAWRLGIYNCYKYEPEKRDALGRWDTHLWDRIRKGRTIGQFGVPSNRDVYVIAESQTHC